jgi:hypothetical protein
MGAAATPGERLAAPLHAIHYVQAEVAARLLFARAKQQ